MADDWLFDTLLQFFQSPRWVIPVASFVETNCVAFDGEETMKPMHKQLHDEFCKLVEGILEAQLSELGVTPEQFVKACDAKVSPELNRLVSDTLLAVDDFRSFRALMERRSAELEFEALRAFQVCGGEFEGLDVPGLEAEEAAMIAAAIAASLADLDLLRHLAAAEGAQLDHAYTKSIAAAEDKARAEGKPAADAADVAAITQAHTTAVAEATARYTAAAATPAAAAAMTKAAPPAPAPTRAVLAPLVTPGRAAPAASGSGAHGRLSREAVPSASKALESAIPPPAPPAGGDDEVAKRVAFLRAQRDKIVADRQRERDAAAAAAGVTAPAPGGKAAAAAAPAPKPAAKVDPAAAEMRRALMARIKDDLLAESAARK